MSIIANTSPEVLIEHTRRGIVLRQRLRDAVLITLWTLGATAVGMLAVTFGGVSAGWVMGAGILGFILGVGTRFPLRRGDAAAAGAYLDRRFSLAERMSSVAGLGASTSCFRVALLDDAQTAFHQVTHPRRIFAHFWPPEVQYLAAPCGLLVVCFLFLGETRPVVAQTATPVTAIPTSPTASPHVTARAHALAAALKAALKRAKSSPSPANRAEAARILAALQRELAALSASAKGQTGNASTPTTNNSPHKNAGDSDAGRGTGAQVKLLQLAAVRAAVTLRMLTNAPPQHRDDKQFQAQAPDWRAYTVWEETLPPTRRAGVEAYLNALATQ